MKTLHFSVMINAPRQKVWRMMLGKETYTKWTAAFMKGSYYEGSWEKGEKIKFLGPDSEGMSGVIAENRPFEFVSIKHIEPINKGDKTIANPDSETSPFGFENYTFSEKNGRTELSVDLEISPDFEDEMKDLWPKALAKLKKICETHTHGKDHSNMGDLKSNIVI